MMRGLAVLSALVMAGPAMAASGPFFSLGNSDFVVLISFLLFIGVLVYFKVPTMIFGMLDKRAESIRSDLDEARALRDEAQSVLAEFERKQRDVQEQADRIVAQAKSEAEIVAAQAQKDLEASIARRLAAAEDQIASAEADAVREVRDTAISVAIAAARDVVSADMNAKRSGDLIDDAIRQVGEKLH